jgi:hypothetical protein
VRRRLFTSFATVSLLLCVAVCVLWVRGLSLYVRSPLRADVMPAEAPGLWADIPIASVSHTVAVAPYPQLILFGLAVPAWWLFRLCRDSVRRPKAAGLCPACGYDLRATPDRCPECGHVRVAL